MRVALALVLLCGCGARTQLAGAITGDAGVIDASDDAAGGDLVLWLDDQIDDAPSGFTWIDKSPHHHDATQTFAGARPTVQPNGKGVVFDGTGAYLVLAPGWEDFTAGMTAFVVARPEHTTPLHAPRFFDFSTGLGTLTDSIIFCRFGAGDELFYQVYDGPTPGPMADAPNTVVDGVWQELSFTAAGGQPLTLVPGAVYRNGALAAAAQTYVPTVLERNSNLIARSNLTASLDTYFKGTMGEIRIYRGRLSDSMRASIDAELAAKWGL